MSNWKANLAKPPVLIVCGLAVVAGSLAFAGRGITPGTAVPFAREAAFLPRTVNTNPSAALSQLRVIDEGMSELAASVSDAVVNIKASASRQSGQGSGFIYRADGWIITNDHVVGDAKTVTVTLADGKEYTGTVSRSNDGQIDLAVVKIDGRNLPTLPVADSNTVRPGQVAMAVGSPFGLENSVTIGHVSATERSGGVFDPRVGARGYTGMIQTDASINPGNSGGPLLNIEGQVIGINSTIYSLTGSNNGIGFAIPSNVAKVVADELITKGKFDRGFLGAELEDLKPFRAKELGIAGGALIGGQRGVAPGTPAAQAGLKLGDVIVAAGGREIRNQLDLRLELYRRGPGDTLPMTVVNGTNRREISVKLAEAPSEQRIGTRPAPQRESMEDFMDRFGAPEGERTAPRTPEAPSQPETARPRFGVQIQELNENARNQFKIPAGTKGVVVVSVGPGSFAEKLGMKPGDVIEEVNGKQIATPDDVTDMVSSMNWGDQVSVTFSRFADGAAQRIKMSQPLTR